VNFVPVDKFIEPYLGFKRIRAYCVWIFYVGNLTCDSGRSEKRHTVASSTDSVFF